MAFGTSDNDVNPRLLKFSNCYHHTHKGKDAIRSFSLKHRQSIQPAHFPAKPNETLITPLTGRR